MTELIQKKHRLTQSQQYNPLTTMQAGTSRNNMAHSFLGLTITYNLVPMTNITGGENTVQVKHIMMQLYIHVHIPYACMCNTYM